jgi:exopolyphosphatase/guanosine-5'-triphosphate,3'-diphosphate pyrophosphatase
MGSNAIRTLIVEITEAGRSPTVLASHRESVRLGQDVFLTGSIPEPAVIAAVEVFRRFREECDRLGVEHIRAIATSATREAENRDLIVERIHQASGIRVEVISGSEEAYLLSVAVARRIDMSSGRSVLADLGGGSVEVTLVESGQVVSAESYRLGALRILQALTTTKGEDQGDDFLDLLDQYVRSLDVRIKEGFGADRIQRYVATGGNIESLADLMRGEGLGQTVDGVESYPLDALSEWARRLATMSHAERVQRLGLKPDRADTILPAAVVYYRLGRVARAEQVLVPRVGMKDGLVEELVAGHRESFRAMDHRETVLSACRALGRKCHYDADHAARVLEFATALFDASLPLHGFGAEERILLEAASLLHDIGVFVSNAKHHRHSWYLIRSHDLVGLSRAEREVVALVARYHRRAHPASTHEEYSGLPRTDRLRVAKLAAILRVADALDREHLAKIARIELRLGKHGADIVPTLTDPSEPNIALETWAVQQKSSLWKEVFGSPVRLVR